MTMRCSRRRRPVSSRAPTGLPSTVSFAAVMLGAAFAAAQTPSAEPPASSASHVLQFHNLAGIVTRIPDVPAPDIELRPPMQAAGTLGASYSLEEPRFAGLVSGEQIEAIVRETVACGTWDEVNTSLCLTPEGRLCVVHAPAVQEQVARLLAWLRHEAALQVVVDGTLAVVEDALLDEWRAKATGPAASADEAAAALAAALSARQRAWRVQDVRVIARNGQQVGLAPVTEHAYVQDYDMQMTSGEAAADPIMGHLRLGAALTVRPWLVHDRFVCEVRFSHMEGTLPIPRFDTGVKGMGALQLPEATLTGFSATLAGRAGRTLLAGRVSLADLKAAPHAPPRSLCLFLRAIAVPREPVEPPPFAWSAEGPRLRLIDAGLLAFAINDFPGPSLLLAPSPGADAAPEREPAPLLSPDALVNMIKVGIAPPSWDLTGCSLDYNNGCLVVRNDPGLLDQVEGFVDREAERRACVVATRVDVVAVEVAAYEDLIARLPAWRTGRMRLDAAEAADLLSRAERGEGGLRIAASGGITGMSGQRVCLRRLGQLAYVRDYDVELAAGAAVPDPQVDIASDGFVMDCRASLADDGKSVELDLAARFAELERPIGVMETGEGPRRVHVPAMASTSFRATLSVETGGALLVGGGGPFKIAGKERHLVALVRCGAAP